MKKLCFLGAGKMASAIAGGLLKNDYPADCLTAFDVSPDAAGRFTAALGVRCVSECPRAAVESADAVLLAVKPQYLAAALAPVRELLSGKLIISIVAGVTIARLAELTGASRIVRVMPNTPAMVGMGCAGIAVSDGAAEEDAAYAEGIFRAVGVAFRFPEALLEGVTALSGSGPAYVFDFIQALADGGVSCGLPRDAALTLAAQTVAGAAQMVLAGEHPAVLRDAVCSPAGTTIRAMQVLEERAFRGAVIAAMRACAERSAELGKKA